MTETCTPFEVDSHVSHTSIVYTGFENGNDTDDDEYFFFVQRGTFGDTDGGRVSPVNRRWICPPWLL